MNTRTIVVAVAALLMSVMAPTVTQAAVHYNIQQMTSGGGDKNDPRLNNAGEIVWWGGGGTVYSSVRGGVSSGVCPSISNTGEIVWLGKGTPGWDLYSSTRGRLTFDSAIDLNYGLPDINTSGEAVYILNTGSYHQVWSTVRGQITFGSLDHRDPSINDLGEIIWGQNGQVFSNVRGQLTFDGSSHFFMDLNNYGEFSYQSSYLGSAPHVFSSVHGVVIPDSSLFQWTSGIDDAGRIVYFSYPYYGSPGQIYMATPVPEPATLSLLAVGGLVALRRRR